MESPCVESSHNDDFIFVDCHDSALPNLAMTNLFLDSWLKATTTEGFSVWLS